MKKSFEVVEWYPIWLLTDEDSDNLDWIVDIPKDKIKWIKETNKEFQKLKNILMMFFMEKYNG